jgi:hypothetical protein
MNNAGQSGEKKSYRVILLLVVGLAAFSSAMKELNQLREFTAEAGSLIASVSNVVMPNPVAPTAVPAEAVLTAVKIETCKNTRPVPVIAPLAELQHGGSVDKPVVAERTRRTDVQIARVNRPRLSDSELIRRQAIHEAELKVMVQADANEELEITIPTGFRTHLPKMKPPKAIIIGPEERELFIKSLTRGINVRSAG